MRRRLVASVLACLAAAIVIPWSLCVLVRGTQADLLEIAQSTWEPLLFCVVFPPALDWISRARGDLAGAAFAFLLVASATPHVVIAGRTANADAAAQGAIYLGGALGLTLGTIVVRWRRTLHSPGTPMS